MFSTQQQIETLKSNGSLSVGEDYSLILQSLGLDYKPVDFYWQVGEITKTQGWILHLSVVLSQISKLLEHIIPILLKEDVPFKIAMTEFIAEDMLNGNFGLAKIGKIVSFYPATEATALALAKKLVGLTKSYKGPNIPTDIRLGSIVYTRYGSFNPVIKSNALGSEEKYIYDGNGQLIKDPFTIPFQLPEGVTWPFQQLTAPKLPEPPKLLNHIYKLIDILKPDARGNVFKGLYVKNLFKVKQCVIKQGFSGMSSDKAGRDIQDRLIWQYELYKELSDVVPLPVIYDLFKEENSTVLVMEFIKGDSLFDKLAEINRLSASWQDLPNADYSRVLEYAVEMTKIINRMHERGYVHRDIVPVNFLLNKKDKIFLIDIELAYSLKANSPNPPFKLGTFGFMSPEQETLQQPTINEDIYGLGATLLYIFTGIFPVKFNTVDTKALSDNLCFFIGNYAVAEMIANCLHQNPRARSKMDYIQEVLRDYQAERKTSSKSSEFQNQGPQGANKHFLAKTVASAVNGLTEPPIIVKNNLWYSRHVNVENYTSNKNKQYSVRPGLLEGICGPLYVLARIKKAGICIASCNEAISTAWEFLKNNHFTRLPEMSPGLYRGSAGFALTLAQNIRGGLLEDDESNREIIQNCLHQANDEINLANGITGQGFSLLLCKDFINNDNFERLLDKIVCNLLSQQKKDGSWLKSNGKYLHIGYDDTGVLSFLLEYLLVHQTSEVKTAVLKGLTQVTSDKQKIKQFYELVASRESYELGDGGIGMIFTLIKAYEVLHEDIFRKLAEDALLKYPPRIIHNNFNQENGLAAIGELYLEAWRVFKKEEWMQRADWIANVFVHSLFKTENNKGYWVMEQNNPPTADYLIGNSGVLHFLARCLVPDKIGYGLLQ